MHDFRWLKSPSAHPDPPVIPTRSDGHVRSFEKVLRGRRRSRPGSGPGAAGNRRLLLTEDLPAYGVLAGLRALHGAGYEVWLAITARDAYGLRSRAHRGVVVVPHPAREPDQYLAALARAAERLHVAAVLPGTELGLLALSGASEAFPSGVRLGSDDQDTVRRATDKLELERLAAEAGLSTPPALHTTRAALESGGPVELPAIVKASRSRTPTADGGFATTFAKRVSTRAELLAAAQAVAGEVVLVQPALEGELMAISGVAWRGEVVTMVHQAARRIYPKGCGITAFAQTLPPDLALEQGVRRLIGALGWSGIFQTQFISSAGTSYLIDLNPRMYGSLALAIAAGRNLPAIWADLLLGRRPQLGQYEIGVRFRSEERELAALAAAAVAGDWRTVFDVLRPWRRTTHALASLRDPLPLLMSGRLARVRRVLKSRQPGLTR
jgi:ATP-grasp in the biosynthetic pathway with Ter operon